jgi:ribonuclease J
MIRSRFGEIGGDVDIRVMKPKKNFDVGPFQVYFQPMAHSIPEAQAVVIKTEYGSLQETDMTPVLTTPASPRYGNIFHTGDWKFDDSPLVGPASDYEGLKK